MVCDCCTAYQMFTGDAGCNIENETYVLNCSRSGSPIIIYYYYYCCMYNCICRIRAVCIWFVVSCETGICASTNRRARERVLEPQFVSVFVFFFVASRIVPYLVLPSFSFPLGAVQSGGIISCVHLKLNLYFLLTIRATLLVMDHQWHYLIWLQQICYVVSDWGNAKKNQAVCLRYDCRIIPRKRLKNDNWRI